MNNLNDHTQSQLELLHSSGLHQVMSPDNYRDMGHGDKKSYNTESTFYRTLFFILLLFNLLYFAVFIYLYSIGSVKIY